MEADVDLYAQFVERFFSSGSVEVPEAWPAEVKKRCNFLVKVADRSGSSGISERRSSVLQSLRSSAVNTTPTPGSEEFPQEAFAKGGRYVVGKEIARGGMGRLLLVYDCDFRRRIAMKVMLGPTAKEGKTSRFIEEAQATAQLEHPNIAPVYDVGVDENDAPFFTMKWIRGRDLEEILQKHREEFSLLELLQILQQVAMGVDFAHSRGVVHRDLKPQNIMVGDYGEVLVVDWGLAKIARREDSVNVEKSNKDIAEGVEDDIEEGVEKEIVTTDRSAEGVITLEGSIQGSISYMPPEQARGQVADIDVRSDVFGLGAILYAILTGQPPYKESTLSAALSKARTGGVQPPGERTPERSIPSKLEEICLKALSPQREQRFQTAREFHQQLQEYVEGIHDAERRAAEAQRLLAEADRLRAELKAAEEELGKEREQERELRRVYKDHQSVEEKQPLLAIVEEVARLGEQATSLFGLATAAYQAVVSIDSRHRAARTALAELYYTRVLAAEERGDREGAKLYEHLVEQYHDGRLEVELHGEAEVHIESDPPGAQVSLSRYEERGLFLVETGTEVLGSTPLVRKLPKGSYLSVLRRPGCVDVRYPFAVDRRPSLKISARLYPAGTIPPGFLQVAGGESIIGGERDELFSLPRSRQWIPEVFVGRFPVTLEDYCKFLNATRDASEGERDPADLEKLLPTFGSARYVVQDAEGQFRPLPQLDPRVPVASLRASSMSAYCAWLSTLLGRQVRLLTQEEWERSARGADGRLYPWGNGFDFALCKVGRSRLGKPQPELVGAFPTDRSPFAVRDLAGCIREVCAGWLEEEEGYRPCHGGSWYNPYSLLCRCEARSRLRDDFETPTDVGFRVCFSGVEEKRVSS